MLERYKIFCEKTREFWDMNVDFAENDVYIKASHFDTQRKRVIYTHYKSKIRKQKNGYFKVFYIELKNIGEVIFYCRKAIQQEIKDYENNNNSVSDPIIW